MNDNLISEFYDIPALKQQAQDAMTLFKAVNAEAKNIEVKVSLAGNYADLQKILAQVTPAMEKLAVANEKAARADLAVAKAAEVRNRSLIAQNKELDRQIDRQDKATASAEKKAAADQKAAATANVARDSLKEMSRTLEDLRKGYYLLTDAERKNEGIGGVLVKRIQELDAALKKEDATLGKFQRNVGNYASGFSPLSNAINQLTREAPAFANSIQTGFLAISNNLPALKDAVDAIKAQNAALRAEGKPTTSILKQLGSSVFSWNTAISLGITLLTVYGKDIVNWAAKLFTGEDALKRIANQEKITQDIRQAGIKSYASEVSHLTTLQRIITDGTLPREKRNEALLAYNEAADKANQIDAKMIDNSAYVEAAIQRQITLIKARALAKGAENVIAEKAQKVFEKELELETRYPQQGNQALADLYKRIAGVNGGNGSAQILDFLDLPKDARTKLANSRKEFKALADDDAVAKLRIIKQQFDYINSTRQNKNGGNAGLVVLLDDIQQAKDGLQDAITAAKPYLDAAGSLSTDPKDKKDKKPKDLTSELLKQQEDETRAYFERLAKQYELLAAQNEAIVNDETKTYDERIKAQEDFTQNSLIVAGLRATGERVIVADKLKEIERIEKKSAAKRTDEEKALLREKGKLLQVKETLEIESDIEQTKVAAAGAKKRNDLVQGEIAFVKANIKSATDFAENNAKLNGQDLNDASSNSDKHWEEEAEKAKKYKEEQDDLYDQAYKKARETVEELENLEKALYQRKFDALDREAELMQRNLAIALNAVDLQGGSEEERAKKKAQLNAQAFAQEQELMNKRRALQRQQAVFEKSISIAEIIADTAVAVVRALGSKPYTPGNIALAAATGALGAAQLATAIATPLPAFEKGGTMKGDGYAIVAEKGPELAHNPDGTKTLHTQPGPTWLRDGTVIDTATATKRVLAFANVMPRYNDNTGRMDFTPLIAAGSAGHNKVAGRLDRTNTLLERMIDNNRKPMPWGF